MNDIKNSLLIGIITFILCLIITITTGISFFWLIIPIIFILLTAFLSKLLKEKFGSSYGIIGYLVLLFAIPLLWYLFSSKMPITSLTLDSKQNEMDLSSFQDYREGVDAKKEVARYQMKQDSVLKDTVSLLLSEGKVEDALALIKKHESTSDKIKKELFSSHPELQEKSQEKNIDSRRNITSKKTSDNTSWGKLAVINDPDGYTNIRSSQGTNYNILGIIREGEQFYVRTTSGDWWQIKSQNGIIGYMHKSRIQIIN
jgi:energy-coupling factor transporter transmembrane protein EcfT